MRHDRSYPEKIADWKRQAGEMSLANWPSKNIRAHLIGQGCPETLARKIASEKAKKRGATLIFAGIAMLLGACLMAFIEGLTGVRFGIALTVLCYLRAGTAVYGVYQAIFD